MKTFIPALLFISALFLHGCLTSEFKEYRFVFNSDGSGEGSIKFMNIVSEKEDEADVSMRDFGELINNYLNGNKFENENFQYEVIEKKLFEENGQLCGIIKFKFASYEDAGFYKDESCECSPVMYYLRGVSESFSESNGKYLGEQKSFPVISWSDKTDEYYFRTYISVNMENAASLLPRYQIWSSNN